MSLSRLAAALIAGLLFGTGLVVSQMIDPAKVLGFLDVAGAASGQWDPSLALVMATAIPVAMAGNALGRRFGRPALATSFSEPAARRIDLRLITGAALFGAGWGLVGYCPGPALAALGSFSSATLLFVAAMLVGMWLFRLTRRQPVGASVSAPLVSARDSPSVHHPPPTPAR